MLQRFDSGAMSGYFPFWPSIGAMRKPMPPALSDEKTQARYRTRARVIKALAHPSRLYIIDALSQGERCVCELQQEIGADMSTVSKHLALLREAGLVADDKRGTQVFYSLRATCVPKLLNCIENVVRENAKRLTESAR